MSAGVGDKRPLPSDAPSGGPHQHEYAQQPPAKSQRSESAKPEAFSDAVKKKLSSSSRTGQACDRCKVRKIRCDARPDGCSNCQQANSQCQTTDRISGKAVVRGLSERLDGENRSLKAYAAALQKQLRDNGIEPSSFNEPSSYDVPPHARPQIFTQGSSSQWDEDASAATYNEPTILDQLPTFRSGLLGDNYFGVSPSNSDLSPIRGTSLTFFGNEIDTSLFLPSEENDPGHPFTYEKLLELTKGEDVDYPPLPPDHATVAMHFIIYFRFLHPYAPVLWKPEVMHLLDLYYREGSQSRTVSELAILHVVYAYVTYQNATRNVNRELLAESHRHFRYAIGTVRSLMAEHSLQAIQALVIMCVSLRNFPKPGGTWYFMEMTFAMVIEMGLHRSAQAWPQTARKPDEVEIETRKRVFWSSHAIVVALSGKLGRPMPIRLSDVDIEFPKPLNDNLPNEPPGCSFHCGIVSAKTWALYSDMYSSIYAIRRLPDSPSYQDNIARLERGLRRLREEVPQHYRDPEKCADQDRVFANYVRFWDLEFRLTLHHPALCPSNNPQLVDENLRICEDVSSQMLHTVETFRVLKSMDYVWINVVVYLNAMFIPLFARTVNRASATFADLKQLQVVMEQWLVILRECGEQSGSGPGLANYVKAIINKAIMDLQRDVTKRTASAAALQVASQPTPASTAQAAPRDEAQQQQQADHSSSYMAPDDTSMTHAAPYPQVAPQQQQSYWLQNQQQTPMPTTASYGYAQPHQTTPSHPTIVDLNDYTQSTAAQEHSNLTSVQQYTSTLDAYGGAGAHNPPTGDGLDYSSMIPQEQWRQWQRHLLAANGMPQASDQKPSLDSNGIAHNAGTLPQMGSPSAMGAGGGHEYLNIANSLMALGGRNDGPASSGVQNGSTSGVAGQQPQQWPQMIYSMPPQGYGTGGQ